MFWKKHIFSYFMNGKLKQQHHLLLLTIGVNLISTSDSLIWACYGQKRSILNFGSWILNFAFCILNFGLRFWILKFGFWIMNFEFLKFEYRILQFFFIDKTDCSISSKYHSSFDLNDFKNGSTTYKDRLKSTYFFLTKDQNSSAVRGEVCNLPWSV